MTPGLTNGIYISLISLVIFLLYFIFCLLYRRDHRHEPNPKLGKRPFPGGEPESADERETTLLLSEIGEQKQESLFELSMHDISPKDIFEKKDNLTPEKNTDFNPFEGFDPPRVIIDHDEEENR